MKIEKIMAKHGVTIDIYVGHGIRTITCCSPNGWIYGQAGKRRDLAGLLAQTHDAAIIDAMNECLMVEFSSLWK